MATRTVKARVELDGEKQYKQALSDLQKGNAVLGSEMRKLQAEYKGNTESTEFLTKKGELLERQLLQQRDKVQTLRDALKNAAQQYGESAQQTQDWQIKLNNAEAAQYDLEAAIRENNEALQGYKQALSDLQKGNAVLDSEMRKLQAEYKGNTESTEFLTKNGELLERQLQQQKDTVQTLRDALKNAAQQYGESAQQTQDWQIELNNAEAAQYELEAAIRENDQALKGEDETMQGLGNTVADLASKLGIRLPEGATKALNGMKGLSAGTVAAMGAAVGGVALLVKGVQALHRTTVEAAAEVDEVLTESMTTGLSTQTIQQLKYAENLIDVSYSTITGTLTKLTKNMAEADGGNQALAESFQALGVSILDTDGNLRSAEAVFYDTIDALGGIENTTQRDALAMELLGKSAQELNPLILQGSEALRQYARQAEQTGYVLDESQLKKLGEVDDAYQEMQLQIDATKKQLAVEFAPASQAAMELYARVVKTAGDALARSGIIEGMASLLRTLSSLFGGMQEASESTLPAVTQRFNALQTVLGGLAQLAALVADTFNVIAGLVPWNWGSGRLSTALGWNKSSGQLSNWQRVYMQQNGTLAQYESYYGRGQYSYDRSTNRYYDRETGWYTTGNPYNAGGTDNWRGGLTWVGEAGPELVALPRGSQILSAQESRGFGGDVFNITIPANTVKEFNDIIEIARSARVRARMRG